MSDLDLSSVVINDQRTPSLTSTNAIRLPSQSSPVHFGIDSGRPLDDPASRTSSIHERVSTHTIPPRACIFPVIYRRGFAVDSERDRSCPYCRPASARARRGGTGG